MSAPLSRLQFSDKDRTLPGMPLPHDYVVKPRPGPAPRQWSGVDAGQLAMGVHDLGGATYQADPHGFFHEPESGKAGPISGKVHLPEADRDGDGIHAKGFYEMVGGAHDLDPMVKHHWNRQPLHQVRADAIVHTAQHWHHETETGRSEFGDRELEGRKRINAIRDDLNQGNEIEKPAWLIKHNQRLYALDGHHRIVAAREAGLAHFPARVWDRDAEQAKKQ